MGAKVMVLTMPGCGGCSKVEAMLDSMGVEYEIVDITKRPDVMQKYPIMTAPGIVINGKLAFTGVPERKELEEALRS